MKELLEEIYFHIKMLQDGNIDNDDFSNAIEQVWEHYYYNKLWNIKWVTIN